MMNRSFYEEYGYKLEEGMFHDKLVDIVKEIGNLYEKHKTLDKLTWKDIYQSLLNSRPAMTNSQKSMYNKLIGELQSDTIDMSEEVIKESIDRFYKAHTAKEIAAIAVDIYNGKLEDFEPIKKLLEKQTSTIIKQHDFEEVENGCLGSTSTDRFVFPTGILANQIPLGLERGNLCFIFARPEMGKSSLVSFFDSKWLKEGRTIAYFGNEEPGRKIIRNHIRAIEGEGDEQIDSLEYPLDAWESVQEGFKFLGCSGKSIGDIERYVEQYKPDIVVIDQLAKVGIKGKFDAGHEKQKALAYAFRELVIKHNCLGIGVSQASNDATDKMYLTYDMMDGSKTGVPGECDVIIGIGKGTPNNVDERRRCITVSKNKINGWHGSIFVEFDHKRNQWLA